MSPRRALAVAAPALVALAALALLSRPAQAQAPAPGVQFLAALQDAHDALPAEDSVPPGDPRLDRVRAPLRLARDLAPDPALLGDLLAQLDRDPVPVGLVRQRLQALLSGFALPPGSVAEDPSAARHTLDQVYSRPQFSGLGRRPSNDDLLTRVGRALLSLGRWLVDHTVGALGVVPSIILGALLAAAIVGFVMLRLQRAGLSPPGRRLPAEPAARGVDPDEEWRLAEQAAAAGEHRQAVRHAFRSALLSVALRGRLRVEAAWTTSELLARARGDADLLAVLAPAADAFDRAWYSGRPVSRQDWETARDRCAAVRRVASSRRVPTA